eukprot:CAMPEP_0181455642 /NCGR_PEP_ID=MMETSP1110-20121109/30862_1 /TAXON_ID=174948 /ORGANISM="Symbiodinium sp., Strain CCMP421" /LENGTH=376 /DNA_ID=CAMNT_0023580031 /DNA_START=41 /DNA_END=1167 /DNA_ORIENTATION=-
MGHGLRLLLLCLSAGTSRGQRGLGLGSEAELCDARHGCGEGLGFMQMGSQALKSPSISAKSPKAAEPAASEAGTTQHRRSVSVLQATTTAKNVGDYNDGAIVFSGMLCVVVIYLLAGSVMSSGEDLGATTAPVEGRLQNFYQRTTSWVMPRMETLQEILPCVSTNLVGASADMPLLVPLKSLEEREKMQNLAASAFAGWSTQLPANVAWHFDITSILGQKILAVQQTKLQDGTLGRVEVIGYRGSGRGKLLGSIDTKLQVFNGEGADFGRLVRKQSGAYELKESATGRHRWMVAANMQFEGHEYFTVTWRPRRRILATVNRGQGSYAEYMKVMPSKGVDVVLVVLCCVGLFVFRLDANSLQAKRPPEIAEDGGAGA